jgi:STE24 endopeptidase
VPVETLTFLAAVAVVTGLTGWLLRRQRTHLRAARDGVPAAFTARVTLAQHQRAIDYHVDRLGLEAVGLAAGVVWLLALTVGGGLAAAVAWLAPQAASGGGQAFGTGLGLWLVLGLLRAVLLDLPLEAWSLFGVEERHGFNRTTWRTFLADQAKGLVLTLLLLGPLMALGLWLALHRATLGAAWWLVLWGAYAAFVLLMQLLYPTVIAPWFNRFTPLPEGSLRVRLEGLLTRCRFPAQGLYVMDGSARSAHGNAYFAGLGRARRIVLFDTLLTQLSDPQVEAVLAHEIGHARCGHVPRQTAMALVSALVAMAAFGLWMDHPAWLAWVGVDARALVDVPPALGDAATILAFFLLLPVATFPLQPLVSLLSRRHEYEADAWAARESDGQALIDGLVALSRDNGQPLTTDAWYSAFHDSHPPVPLRVAALEGLQRQLRAAR